MIRPAILLITILLIPLLGLGPKACKPQDAGRDTPVPGEGPKPPKTERSLDILDEVRLVLVRMSVDDLMHWTAAKESKAEVAPGLHLVNLIVQEREGTTLTVVLCLAPFRHLDRYRSNTPAPDGEGGDPGLLAY